MAVFCRNFHGIGVRMERHIVRIVTDTALKEYLMQEGVGSLELAEDIRHKYRAVFHQELDISTESLAVEILIHAEVDGFMRRRHRITEGMPSGIVRAVQELAERIETSTAVIDCGERSVDGNRWIFDMLAPFHGLIFGILGDRA